MVDYSILNEKRWIPENEYEDKLLNKHILSQIIKLQNYTVKTGPSFENVNYEKRKIHEDNIKQAVSWNNRILKQIKKI
ncbi:hypothetical protein AMJ80_01810 [bacterium SM23_31]|nr:MAG: hypothetical protein AMJ80_01810 [bacterium SM23_31]